MRPCNSSDKLGGGGQSNAMTTIPNLGIDNLMLIGFSIYIKHGDILIAEKICAKCISNSDPYEDR